MGESPPHEQAKRQPEPPFMEASVISFRSINFDIQVQADRWPEASETLIAKELLTLGGGKGANVALLVRRLGMPSSLFACAAAQCAVAAYGSSTSYPDRDAVEARVAGLTCEPLSDA